MCQSLMNLLCGVEQKAERLIAHAFDDNFLLREVLTADRAYVPFTGVELPKNPAVAFWRDSLSIYKPFQVACARRSEFDHLLRGWQDRINLIMSVRRRIRDAKIGADMRANRVIAACAPANVCVRQNQFSIVRKVV